MNRTPVIKTLPINLYWVIAFTFFEHSSSFIILATFTILSQLFIIFVDIDPKIFPIKLKIFYFYINWLLLCLPYESFLSNNSYCSSFSISYFSSSFFERSLVSWNFNSERNALICLILSSSATVSLSKCFPTFLSFILGLFSTLTCIASCFARKASLSFYSSNKAVRIALLFAPKF